MYHDIKRLRVVCLMLCSTAGYLYESVVFLCLPGNTQNTEEHFFATWSLASQKR